MTSGRYNAAQARSADVQVTLRADIPAGFITWSGVDLPVASQAELIPAT